MARYAIRSFKHGFFASDLTKVVNLYNVSMISVYGYHPVTIEQFEDRIVKSIKFKPHLFLVAHIGDDIVGMCHGAVVREAGQGDAGVIEMVAVHPKHQSRGIGTSLVLETLKLLRKEGVSYVDGGGTYPFSPFYSTMLDGSERSGPEITNKSFLKILEKMGFKYGRRSLIMRANLSAGLPPLSDELQDILKASHYSVEARKAKNTWLDFVFRGWALNDSSLFDSSSRELLSRAIFGLMPGLSRFEKKNVYAVFGVNTPANKRCKGLATVHFRELRKYLKSIGGSFMELHCYEDNLPAIKLYEKSGFQEVGRTVSMQLQF